MPAAPPAPAGTFKNVSVLTDLSQAEFNRLMIGITNWVAPKQGCPYCHNPADLASDEKYQKVVSRRMIQMTRNINTNWTGHVAQTGVTCHTCHMGNPVPTAPWYFTDRNQVLRHLLDRTDVRVQSQVALASVDSNRSSIKQTEYAYSLMNRMSRSLGVNCTFCHNSGSGSPATRAPRSGSPLCAASGWCARAAWRQAQDSVLHLPQRGVQAALRRQDGQGLSGSVWSRNPAATARRHGGRQHAGRVRPRLISDPPTDPTRRLPGVAAFFSPPGR